MNKKSYALVTISMLLMAMTANVFAQHEMFLSKTSANYPYISKIINGDTLANGKRADSLRVYVIQRGSNWLFDNVITTRGWDLRMKAHDSTGARPVIYGTVQSGSTTVPIDFIDAGGNVYLKNLVINGIYDPDTSYTSFSHSAPKEIVVFQVAGDFTLQVDSCIILNAYQANLRTFAAMRSIKVTNSVIGELAQQVVNGVGNGRALDIRNVQIDSVIMTNNSIVNGYDRVLRHISSVGRMGYFLFNHNTVVNLGGRYGLFALGKLGKSNGTSPASVTIKNNLFYDAMTFGSDTNSQRQFDFLESGEPFSAAIPAKALQPWVFHQKEADSIVASTFTIQKNYTFYTPTIPATWATIKSNGWMPVMQEAQRMTSYIKARVADTTNAFINLASITLTKVPAPMTKLVVWSQEPSPTGSGGASSGGTNFNDFDRKGARYYRDTLNCSYSTSNAIYTAGTDGLPIGDLNWFPDKLKNFYTLGVKDNSVSPNDFSLEQNYPNPFNPSTQISFTLTKAGMTSLKVYNLLGQEVASLVNDMRSAGRHDVSFNAAHLSSGVYFYTLRSGSHVETKKMMLMK